jgi:hypothetical protein
VRTREYQGKKETAAKQRLTEIRVFNLVRLEKNQKQNAANSDQQEEAYARRFHSLDSEPTCQRGLPHFSERSVVSAHRKHPSAAAAIGMVQVTLF